MQLVSPARVKRKYINDGARELIKEGIYTLAESDPGQYFLGARLLEDTRTVEQSELADEAIRCWTIDADTDDTNQIRIPPKQRVTGNKPFAEVDAFVPDQPFVCELADVTLLPPTGLGLTTAGAVLKDTVAAEFQDDTRIKKAVTRSILTNGYRQTTRLLTAPSAVDGRQLEVATTLVPMYTNYYHWTVECLTRLLGVFRFYHETGTMPTIVLPPNPPSWIQESLAIIGIPSNQCTVLGSEPVHVDRLVVPSYPDPSVTECQWLQQRMTKRTETSGSASDRISVPETGVYIPRTDATTRRVLNEDAVINALSAYGIEPYVLSSLSMKEQIRLFQNVDIIVSPHGAGLTNLLYAHDPTVVELFGRKRKTTYYRLAKLLGFEYYAVSCGSVDTDLQIDIDGLRQLIEAISA